MMFSRERLLQTWRDVRPFFVFCVLLFFAGIIVGGTPGGSTDWLTGQLQGMKEMAEKARSSDHPEFSLFLVIFTNNVIKSVMAMYLGVVAAVVPVVMLVLNGMILGVLFGGYADQGANVWLILLKGILPHGILELPAFFLACAVGIRMGFTFLKGLFGALLAKKEPWQALSRTAAGSVPALILITCVLLVAAVIESTVTFWLVS